MVEIQDRAAQGRACGNLGNVHYLLGDFTKAIHFHEERLKIAREFGDRSAERRAHSNLGNAHIFLGEFEAAAEHYKMTLGLAQELGDRAVEAQVRISHGWDILLQACIICGNLGTWFPGTFFPPGTFFLQRCKKVPNWS